MKFAIETVAETQKTTLAAAGAFAESVLVVTERAVLLNIELTRSACEQSAAMTKACLDACLVMDSAFVPHSLFKSGDD